MKGQLSPSEHTLEAAAVHGRPVHRITSYPAIQHATYFLQSSFTPDGECLLFVSYRSGPAQLYSVDAYPDGPIRQWTDGAAIHAFSPAIHQDGERVFFVRGGSIWTIHRRTLAETLVHEFPGAQLGEVSLSADGDWLTAAAKAGAEAGLVTGKTDGSDWRFIRFPRTVIHPQFHPLEPEWIEFAGDPAPRMHRVRRDGTGLEYLYEHGNDEFVVHETFLGQTGDIVYTVWPFALWRFDWHTRERRQIAEFNAWHITPNRQGTQVLCDTNHPDRGIHLIDVATGRVSHVCNSLASSQGSQWKTSRYALAADFAAARSAASKNLSWMEASTDTVYGPQWTHPHPSFSPDERRIVFTSDRTGHPQVYVADLSPEDDG